MLDNPDSGDNHNARTFLWCYKRMGEFVPQLLDEGFQPRVMLEYSGTLLYGLRQMGATDVLDALARLTGDERNHRAVEWLGCPWGHAVAPSTPVQDYRLHVEAWQHHFAAIFGLDALRRVRGFSPSEMAVVATWDIRSRNSDLDDDLTSLLAEEEVVRVKSEGIPPLSLTCNSHMFMKEQSILCLVFSSPSGNWSSSACTYSKDAC